MSGLHHLQPDVARLFQRRDRRTRTSDQDFRAGTGERIQTGGMQPRNHLFEGEPGNPRNVYDLGTAE